MRLPLLALAIALLTVPLAGCVANDPAPPPGSGSLEWEFTDTQGQTHSNETAQGTPTVFFFMATWCTSCQDKASDLRAVHGAYEEQGVDVFSLSWDPDEDEQDLEQWKAEYEQPWPHGNDPDLEIQRTFGVNQQSEVVLLDEDNRMVQHWGYGQVNQQALSTILDDQLG